MNGDIERIDLSGEATAPVISLSADRAPATPLGCAATQPVTVENQGSEPLHLQAAQLEGAADFGPAPAVAGLTIGPHSATTLDIPFAPPWSIDGGGERQARLRLWSDDPYRPEAAINLAGLAYEGEAAVETFTYAPATQADLLLLVDPGGVMDAYLGLARTALGGLIDGMVAANVDLHVAALTTAGPCPVTIPPWADLSSPAATTALLQEATEGSAAPRRLIAIAADALAADHPGGCLEGFRRPGAPLSLVFIAGGPDADALPPADALAQLTAAAGLPPTVSAIIPTQTTGCGGLSYGEGYADLALLTSGLLADICLGDWGGSYDQIVTLTAAPSAGDWEWTLTERPLPASLRLSIDGAPFTDWTYEPATNRLRFAGPRYPDPGDVVEVAYDIEVPCP